MSANLDSKLDFYIKNGKNVLFEGLQGIGKSSIIISAFERNKIKYKYFSAPTMDPWVDLVGIPKECKSIDGKSYIDLIRPKDILDGEIEAFIFDEFNRAPSKVRNAVLEIMQFKSINGYKLPNLRLVWAAVNPDNHDNLKFDVDPMDPAQRDRFHAHISLPYSLDMAYFNAKYSENETEIVANWWSRIPEDIRLKVSPRRVDYAMEIYKLGGDIRDVLPAESNVTKLLQSLKTAPIVSQLADFYKSKDIDKAIEFLKIDNNYFDCIDLIKENKAYRDFFFTCFPKERIATLLISDVDSSNYILSSPVVFGKVLEEISSSSTNIGLRDKINRAIGKFSFTSTTTEKYPVYMIDSTPMSTADAKRLIDLHAEGSVYFNISSKPASIKRSYIRQVTNSLVKPPDTVCIAVIENLLQIVYTSNFATIMTGDINIIKLLNTYIIKFLGSPSLDDLRSRITLVDATKGLVKLTIKKSQYESFVYNS